MSLTLKYRWEHALLAATIAKASEECLDCYLGRTAIQKLLYFMKVLNVPMQYDFDIYHYGPFCSSVSDAVEWLLADEVIKDVSNNERYSNYQSSTSWQELKEQYAPNLAEHDAAIQGVVSAFSGMTPENLELSATLDFCFRWVHARGGQGPWKEDTVRKFKEIKKDKFNDSEVDKWYGILVKANLIEQ